MTTVGHTLTGLGLAALAMPPGWGRRARRRTALAFFALASAPDAPLPGWGHLRYEVSHSLFVTLAIVATLLAAFAAAPGLRARLGGWKLPLFGAAAWLSHLLLDSLYSHGNGLPMFWPLSDTAALALPVPWFHVLPSARGLLDVVRIFAIEGVCYGLFLAACLAWRRRVGTRRGEAVEGSA